MALLHALERRGHHAFLVGGGVRDLLRAQTPNDFDIATDAYPEAVRWLFHRLSRKPPFHSARIIGRRFRLVHVRMRSGNVIEVTTFRDDSGILGRHGTVRRDNNYGDMDQDAQRRDFTVNGLYCAPDIGRVYDFFNGPDDLSRAQLRIIGDTEIRCREKTRCACSAPRA